jgi:hypothetical protein
MSILQKHHVTLDQATINAGLARGRIERSRAVHAVFSALGRGVKRVFVRPARLRVKPQGACRTA